MGVKVGEDQGWRGQGWRGSKMGGIKDGEDRGKVKDGEYQGWRGGSRMGGGKANKHVGNQIIKVSVMKWKVHSGVQSKWQIVLFPAPISK